MNYDVDNRITMWRDNLDNILVLLLQGVAQEFMHIFLSNVGI